MTRAHRSLWILTALTVLAAGLTAQALARPAGLGTHLQLAASLLLLAVSGTLLFRVLRYLVRPATSPGRASSVPEGEPRLGPTERPPRRADAAP